jgi:hypothetical protein
VEAFIPINPASMEQPAPVRKARLVYTEKSFQSTKNKITTNIVIKTYSLLKNTIAPE